MPHDETRAALRMSGEIRDWLADLRVSDPAAAARVVEAVAALLTEGGRHGGPLVTSTAGSWPAALIEALDSSYSERLAQLSALRAGEADAAKLVQDIEEQAADLASAEVKVEELRSGALAAGHTEEAAEAAGKLAALRQQAAQVRGLLPGVTGARRRLSEKSQRLKEAADAMRARKETLKGSYTAAHSTLLALRAVAAADPDGDRDREDGDSEAIRAAEARCAEIVTQMERELGAGPWPEGLMELRPGAPEDSDVAIFFAIEPPGAAQLLAVLQGPGAVADRHAEALMASADLLRRARAGQAPEAAAHTYDGAPSFLAEFDPRRER
jgi:hypothetical protein